MPVLSWGIASPKLFETVEVHVAPILRSQQVGSGVDGRGAASLEDEERLVRAIDVVYRTVPIRSDRQRLLDMTDSLILAIEAVSTGEMKSLSADLDSLRKDAEHLRQVVGEQWPQRRLAGPFF